MVRDFVRDDTKEVAMHVRPRTRTNRLRLLDMLAATAIVAATLVDARPAVAAPATCRVLVQTTSRNDEMLDRVREQARTKLTASGRYQLVTDPRAADATVETNSIPMKGRLGGSVISGMLLAGQHSGVNTQVLLNSFLAVYAVGQEEAAADAIVAMLDKAVADQGDDLCPRSP